MSEKRITFIINPVAGGRRKDKFERKLKKIFGESGYEVKSCFTMYPSHAFEFAREEVQNGTDVVVAVGGDGTINEVARALIGSGSVLGIIPFGSGNGFARHFGFPLTAQRALKTLRRERPGPLTWVTSMIKLFSVLQDWVLMQRQVIFSATLIKGDFYPMH